MSSEQFMAGLIFPDSTLILPHDIGYTPTMSSPKNKRSPKFTAHPVASIESTLSKSMMSPTIRITPPREDAMATPPTPRRRNSSGSSKSKKSRRRSKSSPREAKPEPIEAPPLEDCVSESRSICADWLLEDLIRDGMLDIDAVHTALGLGLPSPPTQHSQRYPSPRSSYSTSSPDPGRDTHPIDTCNVDAHIRKPGALLSSIPEETEDISDAGHSDEPAQFVGLWEAACQNDAAEETSSAESSTLPTPVVGGQRSHWYF